MEFIGLRDWSDLERIFMSGDIQGSTESTSKPIAFVWDACSNAMQNLDSLSTPQSEDRK